MPVLMKDEKKYSECVDVLEKWTKEIIPMQDFAYQNLIKMMMLLHLQFLEAPGLTNLHPMSHRDLLRMIR